MSYRIRYARLNCHVRFYSTRKKVHTHMTNEEARAKRFSNRSLLGSGSSRSDEKHPLLQPDRFTSQPKRGRAGLSSWFKIWNSRIMLEGPKNRRMTSKQRHAQASSPSNAIRNFRPAGIARDRDVVLHETTWGFSDGQDLKPTARNEFRLTFHGLPIPTPIEFLRTYPTISASSLNMRQTGSTRRSLASSRT